MGKERKRRQESNTNDEQAVRKDLSRQFDHEFANEPLSQAEKANNKKTKKRQ
ncbi:small acid-soluble spore protein O (minor) [Gracilibacillus ureilyticus]|uniref:Small acid-soluble spore protein O n=1 Tax=Gracilibacillus ureilyticus TaxID=531814 RepID=A0A1H9UVZ3_9BACI|nr:small acid-soluble spore protein O [Gracilibacillus ureilyticus]SES13511.1 small acid-soluble spore protein O (minor) [Gracilibacillus ureilyticus]